MKHLVLLLLFGIAVVLNTSLCKAQTDRTTNYFDGHPDWIASQQKILFQSDRHGGKSELYTVNIDGSELRRITENNYVEAHPRISPDGLKIIYSASKNEDSEIYILEIESGKEVQLTDNKASDTVPVWSPDGRKIAFSSDRSGRYEIYVMNADGSSQRQITFSEKGMNSRPAWSPDGRRIAFHSNRDGNREIYSIDLDGQNLRRLTVNKAKDSVPWWSPDGSRIIFLSDRNGNGREIYMLNVDDLKTEPLRLTNNKADNGQPVWADKQHIIFYSNRDGRYSIYMMEISSNSTLRVTK